MGRLNRQQHEERNGGSFTASIFFGAFTSLFRGIFIQEVGQENDHKHLEAIVNNLDSLDRRLAAVFAGLIYADSTDSNIQFSFAPFSIDYRGLWCTYAGAVNLGPLTAGATNLIWIDFSAAPNLTIGFGATWPSYIIPHLRVGAIAQPASGDWKPQHLSDYIGGHAAAVHGASLGKIIKAFAYNTALSSGAFALGTIAANTRVIRAHVKNDIAFDGTAPLLSIGDAGDNDRLMATGDNNLKTTDPWSTSPFYVYGSQTDLKVFLTPSTATVGSGIVILEVA